MKPELLRDITALPPRESHRVMEKIALLALDPMPDGKSKKRIKHASGKICRIRSGDYRILYSFDAHNVSILTIRKRNESTYDDDLDCDDELDMEDVDALKRDLGIAVPEKVAPPDWESFVTQKEKPLPEPITVALLTLLRIPPAYHSRLLRITTQDALLSCPGVPDDFLLKIDSHMFETPVDQIIQQPDLVLNYVNDLLRYQDGELLAFLLKLSPEQERYATWPLNATGPILVKGGPGTGKSTVALYRIRSLLQQVHKVGQPALPGMGQDRGKPTILFTTYTNALVKSSEQLLEQLLGHDAQYVRVQTTDSIVGSILGECRQHRPILTSNEERPLIRQAVAEIVFEGNAIQQMAQKLTIERMGPEYLLAEIKTIIVARQIGNLAEYLEAPRTGRKLRMNMTARKATWKVYQRWCELVAASGKETWEQQRARAEALAEQSRRYKSYDAVVIDEAQDLDPSALRLLVKLCKSSNRIFVTADANQSIYGSGFSWRDVHEDLKFQGRTSILHANYRSTREIGEAAQSYLAYGSLEPEVVERRYIYNGPIPDVRAVLRPEHEIQLLASYFKKACSDQRLTLSSCAVLCPGEGSGKVIVAGLEMLGIKAMFMNSRNLDLKQEGVKVLPLKAAKGLEFPIVALSGFLGGGYPDIPAGVSEEERDELLARERRTIYVGMTRAMRTLLVIIPTYPDTPVLDGFASSYWSMGKPSQ